MSATTSASGHHETMLATRESASDERLAPATGIALAVSIGLATWGSIIAAGVVAFKEIAR